MGWNSPSEADNVGLIGATGENRMEGKARVPVGLAGISVGSGGGGPAVGRPGGEQASSNGAAAAVTVITAAFRKSRRLIRLGGETGAPAFVIATGSGYGRASEHWSIRAFKLPSRE